MIFSKHRILFCLATNDNRTYLEIFHGEYVLPTIARNDPAYGDNDYWRGRIWGPINFLVYLGMQRYDVKEARTDLIARSKQLLMKNWQANGGIFENYNSKTGQERGL